MGGKGSGGSRPNAGRKPIQKHLRAIDGGASHSKTVTQAAAAPPADVAPAETFPPPSELYGEDLLTWEALSPLAFEARTLTRGTAYAFSLFCRNVVIERMLSRTEAGSANHRGMVQRVQADATAFGIRPNGKPVYEAKPVDKPVNPLDRFLKKHA